MSSLLCHCGRSISLVCIPLDNGAHFLRDTDELARQAIAQKISAYIQAIRAGKREAFIETFDDLISPDDSDADIINFLLDWSFAENSLEAFQCNSCGRIWIEDNMF